MGNKFVINFDFDGVLIDSIKAVSDVYFNRHYSEIMEGLIPTPFHQYVKKWNFQDEFPHMHIYELDSIFQSEEFFNNASFITDPNGLSMKDLFEELIDDDRFKVLITTKGTVRNLALKHKFIEKEFPQFDMDNFIGMLGTDMDKSSLRGNLIIDDVFANLKSANGVSNKILFAHRGVLDCEWNENHKDCPEIIVCTSVGELANKIGELYEKTNNNA